MSDPTFKDHFSTGSVDYATYRPTYPRGLVDALADVCAGHERALDCCCGTGQLSTLLAERFDEVVATDASAAQIAAAQPRPRVTYRTGLAEESGLAAHSVDLITVAQAAHWLDLDKFYAEVRRVARPGAVVALICYGVLHVSPKLDRAIEHFYEETLGPYWPPERRLVEEGYRSLPFPFEPITLAPLEIEAHWRLDELLGYLSTWSATKRATEALGTSPLHTLHDELRQHWGDPTTRHKITWPLSTLTGRVQR